MKMFIFLIIILLTTNAFAVGGPFKLTPDLTGLTVLEAEAARQAFAAMENQVNNDLPDADASTYLNGMANASVISSKGVGSYYADDIDIFVVGAGVGIGADLGDSSFSDLMSGRVDTNQIRGVGLSPSIMLGVHMGVFPIPDIGYFDWDKFDLFLNFFKYDYDKTDAKATVHAETQNFGIHGRYKIYDGFSIFPFYMLDWKGVTITSGYERNSLLMRVNKSIPVGQTVTTQYAGETATGNVSDINALVGAEVKTNSIPIAVSTSMQWLYVMTTYLGLGTDLNWGEAKAIANASGSASLTVGGKTVNATTSLDIGQTADPNTFMLRGFVGHQFNLSIVKIYAQLDKVFGHNLVGVTAGFKIAW